MVLCVSKNWILLLLFLPWFVSKLFLELLQRLIQLILSDQVSSVVAQLCIITRKREGIVTSSDNYSIQQKWVHPKQIFEYFPVISQIVGKSTQAML